MPLPSDIQSEVDQARTLMLANATRELILPNRKTILSMFGDISFNGYRAVVSDGLIRRTNLALMCANRVLPIWQNDGIQVDINTILTKTAAYIDNPTEEAWEELWLQQNELEGIMQNVVIAYENKMNVVYAGFTASEAALIALKDMYLEDIDELDEETVRISPELYASGAEAGDMPGEPASNKSIREQFWLWYLGTAIPDAYVTVSGPIT